MAGLIEFSRDVIWYSADGPYRAVLGGAAAYLDDPDASEALADALATDGLLLPAVSAPAAPPLLHALDRSLVRLMAELVNSAPGDGREERLQHFADLRAMVRDELALRAAQG